MDNNKGSMIKDTTTSTSKLNKSLNLDGDAQCSAPSIHCTGHAHFFCSIRFNNSNSPLKMKHQLLYHRLSPDELDQRRVYFMDCPNHVNYSMKVQGSLCILHCTMNASCNLGFIISVDTIIKVALCHNTKVFFDEYVHEPQHYFRTVRTITFNDIFSNKIKIFYINQLNQTRPYQQLEQPSSIPSSIISQHDFTLSAASSYDVKHTSAYSRPSRRVYETMEVSSICSFCNMQHCDLNDRSIEITQACKHGLMYLPKENDVNYKKHMYELLVLI